MSRVIEFRSWDKESQQIFEVAAIDFENGGVRYKDNPSGNVIDALFEQIELLQYTGLPDKNGTKIFEGDVVKFEANNRRYEVKFTGGCFEFGGWSVGAYSKQIEVIGNIFENPEILKGE